MGLSKEISGTLEKIYKDTSPVSIFIYGSRARTDFKKNSDYEIGVLYLRDKKVGRGDLAKLHNIKGLNLYPFVYEEFLEKNLDTPFPKAIYMKELTEGAITVFGEKVVEEAGPIKIYASDLLEEATFQIAYALAAVLSSRRGDVVTASIEFTKSALFGTRVLVILRNGKFPLEYDEIAKIGLLLDLDDEYKEVISHALAVRKGKELDFRILYTNISFLNQVVLKEVKGKLETGNGQVPIERPS